MYGYKKTNHKTQTLEETTEDIPDFPFYFNVGQDDCNGYNTTNFAPKIPKR